MHVCLNCGEECDCTEPDCTHCLENTDFPFGEEDDYADPDFPCGY